LSQGLYHHVFVRLQSGPHGDIERRLVDQHLHAALPAQPALFGLFQEGGIGRIRDDVLDIGALGYGVVVDIRLVVDIRVQTDGGGIDQNVGPGGNLELIHPRHVVDGRLGILLEDLHETRAQGHVLGNVDDGQAVDTGEGQLDADGSGSAACAEHHDILALGDDSGAFKSDHKALAVRILAGQDSFVVDDGVDRADQFGAGRQLVDVFQRFDLVRDSAVDASEFHGFQAEDGISELVGIDVDGQEMPAIESQIAESGLLDDHAGVLGRRVPEDAHQIVQIVLLFHAFLLSMAVCEVHGADGLGELGDRKLGMPLELLHQGGVGHAGSGNDEGDVALDAPPALHYQIEAAAVLDQAAEEEALVRTRLEDALGLQQGYGHRFADLPPDLAVRLVLLPV